MIGVLKNQIFYQMILFLQMIIKLNIMDQRNGLILIIKNNKRNKKIIYKTKINSILEKT